MLVVLALTVLACLPFTLPFSLLRNWLADRPFSFWWAVLLADLKELVGFFSASWRGPIDDGEDSGA